MTLRRCAIFKFSFPRHCAILDLDFVAQTGTVLSGDMDDSDYSLGQQANYGIRRYKQGWSAK